MPKFDTEAVIFRQCKRSLALAESGVWDGKEHTPYTIRCINTFMIAPETVCVLMLTRDYGHHSSGWWKNPDYERCWHLSLSFRHVMSNGNHQHMKRDCILTRQIIDCIYGMNARLIWCEPPYTKEGKQADIWHYRLFCNENWQPIKPRGEVYSKELTESGWLSFSDVRAGLKREQEVLDEILEGWAS